MNYVHACTRISDHNYEQMFVIPHSIISIVRNLLCCLHNNETVQKHITYISVTIDKQGGEGLETHYTYICTLTVIGAFL